MVKLKGSWIKTAKEYTLIGNKLHTMLKNNDGKWVKYIYTVDLSYTYYNNNGKLVKGLKVKKTSKKTSKKTFKKTSKNTLNKNNYIIQDNKQIDNTFYPNKSNFVIYIISSVLCGGTFKYIQDLINLYPKTQFITIHNYNELISYKYNEKDILFIQHLIDTDIKINYILEIKTQFKLKIIITIHDFIWLNDDLYLHSDNTHNKYLDKNIQIKHDVQQLFKMTDLIIHPSKFTFNMYAQYFDMHNFKLINHPDIDIDSSTKYIPNINDNIINIGVLHEYSIYKGKDYIEILIQKYSDYKNYIIKFFIVGENIPKYNQNMYYQYIKNYNLHALTYLNKWGETHCYSLSYAINSGLPIIYNDIGVFIERLKLNSHYFPVFDNEININIDLLYQNFEKLLDYIIENNGKYNKIQHNIEIKTNHIYDVIMKNNSLDFSNENKMVNILVYGHVPYSYPSGNSLRIKRMIEYLAQYYNVYFYLTNGNDKYKKYHKINNNQIDIVDIPYINIIDFKEYDHKLNNHNFLGVGDASNIINLISKLEINVVICEYVFNSFILDYIDDNIFKIIDLHDKMSNKPHNNLIYIPIDIELTYMNRADLCISITNEEHNQYIKYDKQLLCKLVTSEIEYQSNTNLITNNEGIKSNNDSIILNNEGIISNNDGIILDNDDKYIFFCGTDNEFNVQCLNEFIQQCWPLIKKPLKLIIAGNICNKLHIIQLDIKLVGILSDIELDKYIRQSYMCINPVYIGTGLKIKTMKYLENCKFVVSFMEGIKGYNCIDFDEIIDGNWILFAEKINFYIENKQYMNNKLENILQTISIQFNPDKIYHDLIYNINIGKKSRELCVIFVTYNNIQSINVLDMWLTKNLINTHINIIIVNNNINQTILENDIKIKHNFLIINGSNKHMEFSGFNEGILKLDDLFPNNKSILLVTDMFNSLYTGYLNFFRENYLNLTEILDKIMIGHIDITDKLFSIDNIEYNFWIRSCFILTNRSTIHLFNNNFIPADFDHYFYQSESFNINNTLLDFCKIWLSGKKLENDCQWHRSINCDTEIELFHKKVYCIICEHSLTQKALQKNAIIFDIRYLFKYGINQNIDVYNQLSYLY